MIAYLFAFGKLKKEFLFVARARGGRGKSNYINNDIKKAFKLYAAGKYTLEEIRKIVNNLGLRGRKGKLLSIIGRTHHQIHKFLKTR